MELKDAIAHAKEVAESKRKTIKEVYENLEEDRPLFEEQENACLKCAEEHEQLVEWLEELAERREADRWISVKERLPEDYTKVLITNEYGVVNCVDWNTLYQNDYKNARKTYKAIAWRPLPEAYKEREDK